ncbi:hypothetical protein AHT62_004309, partial [Salmonella enterica subsp. enterica serovar Lexington]|nr:hypothetical protein [Salmonella enterica subsp. enterica serovar Lexington]
MSFKFQNTLLILSSLPLQAIAFNNSPVFEWELTDSVITGFSERGGVITGYNMSGSDRKSFIYLKSSDGRWSKQNLDTFDLDSSNIYGVSSDGSVIYGSYKSDSENVRAFTLTRKPDGSYKTLKDIGTFYKGNNDLFIGNSEIRGSTYSGDIIIGKASSFEGVTSVPGVRPAPDEHAFYAFRNSDGTYSQLGEITGFNSYRGKRKSEANAISIDGNIIVGSSDDGKNKYAFVTYRMKDDSGKLLNNYSQMYNIANLNSAYSMGDNFMYVVGASNSGGESHAAVAYPFREYIYPGSNTSTYGWKSVDLGTLRKGNRGNSVAYAIGGFDDELVVGQSDTDLGVKQAFFSNRTGDLSFSTMKSLGSLKKGNTGESIATNVSSFYDKGKVVYLVSGYSETDDNKKHAFMVKLLGSVFLDPPPPPEITSGAMSPPMITDPGSVVDPDLEIEPPVEP